MIEFDGLIAAESDSVPSRLVTVEAKHSLKKGLVDKRREKLTAFIHFLSAIPESDDRSARPKYRSSCGQLRPYKDWEIDHYIGGTDVHRSVTTYAQKMGFHVLQYRGDRYDVANPRSTFVPT